MYPYGNQQYGTGYPQATGYNNWPSQQQQYMQPSLQTQPTGFGFQSQATGWNQQPQQCNSQFQPQQNWQFQQPQQQPQQQSQQQPQQQPQQQAYQRQDFQAGYQGGLQPMAAQATGYQPSLATQQTGFQPLTATQTGFQPRTSFGGNQPIQNSWQSQTGVSGLQPQQTGFTSSLVTSSENENKDIKIPNIRLSFITAKEQERFEHVFRVNVPRGENSIDGQTAKKIMMQSGLSATKLADIWALADTTRSGRLLFPEFALALHLCNIASKGEQVPYELPLKIKNEVSSFVDAINFSVNDSAPQQSFNQMLFSQPTGVQSFPQTSFQSQPLQPQATGLRPQQTGFGVQTGIQPQQTQGMFGLQPQRTGFTQQQTGLQPQRTGLNLQPQQTGFNLQSQQTGFGLQPQQTGAPLQAQKTGTFIPLTAQQTSGLVPVGSQNTAGLQPQTTGVMPQRTGGFAPQQTGLLSQATGFNSQQPGLMPQPTGLTAMPTGKPGQWGFVSAPTGGLPGLDMMQSHFMPNASSQTHHLTNAMGGNAASNVTWAITKQEKLIYDNIFKKWDTDRKGYVEGSTAITVFGKSGLNRQELEKIWTLADSGNRGKLNKDEFAVAMHLIYRRLNGFDIPDVLPPELVPPSSKLLLESMNQIKGKLMEDSISSRPKPISSSSTFDGTRYKNDDDAIGYVSNARHRSSKKKSDEKTDNQLTIEELRKKVHEKKILLDAIDAADEDIANDYGRQKTVNEIDMLKVKIRAAQDKLNAAGLDAGSSIQEKQKLSKELNRLTDRVPKLVSELSSIDEKIKNAKIEIARLKIHKENPSGIQIKGTGRNGEVTEADKRIAKQKAMLQAKMAALTGKPAPNLDQFEANEARLSQDIDRITNETQQQQSMVKDIAGSINQLVNDISSSLHLTNSAQVGYSKWELGNDIQSSDVKTFIRELNASKPSPKPKDSQQPAVHAPSVAPVTHESVSRSSTPSQSPDSLESRAQQFKEQARRKMEEKLAKLGIKGSLRRSGESVQDSGSETSAASVPPQAPVEPKQEAPAEPAKPSVPKQAPAPPAPRQVSNSHPAKEEDSSDDDDAEEEELKRLIAEKKAMEAKERERKLKKKQDREARLAKLRAEMEELKKKEARGESSDEDELEDSQANREAVPPPSAGEPAKAPEPVSAASVTSAHSNNPFAKMAAPVEESEPKPKSNNPFFKPQLTSESSYDADRLKAQREAQRGKSLSDDGWSDSDKEDEDEDEMPAASKQAELASMLFGGGVKSSSSTVNEHSAPQTEQHKPVEQTEAERPAEHNYSPAMAETDTETVPSVPAALPVDKPLVEEIPPVPAAPPIPQAPVSSPESDSSEDDSFEEAPAAPDSSDDSEAIKAPPVPSAPAPPAPPASVDAPPMPASVAPPPPPAPAPPAPPAPALANGAANGVVTETAPISALLGEITLGKQLRKVDDSQKHIVEGGTVGKVLD
ncbi:hypothetical protein KL907_003068 [Ogataea polymorpha]|nr:hypothetical protein KL907_003068 [Ogataea polymorpha]